jgi:hypothetical protein
VAVPIDAVEGRQGTSRGPISEIGCARRNAVDKLSGSVRSATPSPTVLGRKMDFGVSPGVVVTARVGPALDEMWVIQVGCHTCHEGSCTGWWGAARIIETPG